MPTSRHRCEATIALARGRPGGAQEVGAAGIVLTISARGSGDGGGAGHCSAGATGAAAVAILVVGDRPAAAVSTRAPAGVVVSAVASVGVGNVCGVAGVANVVASDVGSFVGLGNSGCNSLACCCPVPGVNTGGCVSGVGNGGG